VSGEGPASGRHSSRSERTELAGDRPPAPYPAAGNWAPRTLRCRKDARYLFPLRTFGSPQHAREDHLLEGRRIVCFEG
jgi:hypothetical protein